MTFLAFVIFAFNISVIGYLIYSWSTRNKPVLTPEQKTEKAFQKRWARTPEENRKRDLRYDRLTTLFIDPGMLFFWFIILPPTLVVLYVIYIY